MSMPSMSATRKNYMNRRCFTALPVRPKTSKTFCHACTYRLVKQIEDQRSNMFMSSSPFDIRDRKPSSASIRREEVTVAKTTVPKKGLIKLTALDNEIKNPLMYDKREREVQSPIKEVREKQRRQKIKETQGKMLIKRKGIMDQVVMGNIKLMEEEEKQHLHDDLDSRLSDFTFGDLQMNIEKLTDVKKQRSSESIKQTDSKDKSSPYPEATQRGLALPAINTINLFS